MPPPLPPSESGTAIASGGGQPAPNWTLPRPQFSLVVPTIGRVREVEALLESITKSTIQDLETVVVDQNQDDRLVGICRSYSTRMPLRHCRVAFRGASRARNYGAKYATGDVLAFPDDDAELTPALLADVRQVFDRQACKVVIGICVDRNGAPSTTRFAMDERTLTPWSMWGRHAECTMFFDRTTFLASGGYDEAFGVGSEYGSDEGPELLIRLFQSLAPGEIYYSHKLRYYHPEKAKDYTQAGIDRVYSYARGSGALLAKWPLLNIGVHSINMLTRAAAGSFVFTGSKRRYYRARVRGFFSGYKAYRLRTRSADRRLS